MLAEMPVVGSGGGGGNYNMTSVVIPNNGTVNVKTENASFIFYSTDNTTDPVNNPSWCNDHWAAIFEGQMINQTDYSLTMSYNTTTKVFSVTHNSGKVRVILISGEFEIQT